MSSWASVLITLLAIYAAATSIFIVMENRRPQATFAWAFLLLGFPLFGLLIYVLFGRDRKAFSHQRELARHDLGSGLTETLNPIQAHQDEALAELAGRDGPHSWLARLVQHNAHSMLTTRNQVEILQNAAEKYARLIDDLETARHYIHLQYFIWASDAFTEKLKAILIAKVKEGVEVRLLYDPVGCMTQLSFRYIREMRAGGIEMVPFSPLYQLHTISYRNHRKIVVIDGVIGYTGGLNMSREHLDGGKRFDFWRDTHVRIVGETAAVLQAIFAVDWYNAVAEDVVQSAPVRLLPAQVAEADLPVQTTVSGPDSEWRAIRQLYFAMILAARRHVFIQSPFFIPDESIAEAIKTAALSGIDVRVMVGAHGTGNELPHWATNTYLKEIAAAGARVFHYQKGYFHAKTISIDSEVCSIGSANLDIRSFSINYELNVIAYDQALATSIEAAFMTDVADCREFSFEDYRQRSFPLRLRDSCARLLSPLL